MAEPTLPEDPGEPEAHQLRPPNDWDAAIMWVKPRWRGVLIVGSILLMAIACRKMHFSPDSIHYVDVARTIVSEHVIASWHLTLNAAQVPQATLYWPPMYPLLLAVPMALGLSYYTAAWLIAVLSGAAAIYLLVFWLRRPVWAIPLVALFLYLYFDTGLPFRALSEVPYVPIIFGALLCTAAAVTAQSRRQRLLLAVSAGLLAGAAVLMRHMGVAILPALAAALLLAPQREDEEGAKPLWQITLGMVVGLAIVVLPWLVRNLLVGSELLGLERPASQMSLRDLAFWTGSMIYLHLGPALLALTFAAVGYHLRPRGEDSRREAFISTLTAGAFGSAIVHAVLVLVVQMLFQLDEPPTKRFFYPANASLLLGAAAMLSYATPPKGVLARRAGLIIALAAPIVLGPIFVSSLARDITPRQTALDQWIRENTSAEDLIIANRGWSIRFNTGRPVLQSGQVGDPPITDGERVAGFLERFGGEFGEFYLVLPAEDEETLGSYRRAGLEVEEVVTLETLSHDYDRPEPVELKVYRVTPATPLS